jgi:hypothetical protein
LPTSASVRLGGAQAVLAGFKRGLGAGDHGALEGGAAAGLHIKAAIARLDAGLLGHAGKAAVDAAAARAQAGARGRAHGQAAADVLAALLVLGGVLQALQDELALRVNHHALAAGHGAAEGGVCAAGQGEGVARINMAVGTNAHTHRCRTAAVAAGLALLPLGGQQGQVALRGQGGVAPGLHLTALHGEV